jgi:biotin operon repressor
MSIALMALAWKSDFASGKKMVLLALCDNANDQGECYPSISMLAEKCSIGRSSVFEHIAQLEKSGAVRKQCRAGRSTIYKIDPSRFQTSPDSAPVQKLDYTRPESGRTPVQISDVTRPDSAPITIKEPSIEPKKKKEPASQAFILPDWINKKHWDAWHSCDKRKKATNEQKQLAVEKLDGWRMSGIDYAAALENAAVGGWQGLFKPDEKTASKAAMTNTSKYAGAARAIWGNNESRTINA